MNNSDVIKRIERAAWLARVSIKALCVQAGVSQSTFWRWKKGHVVPDLETVEKLVNTAAELQKNNEFLRV
jgi:predicted transcriptional regulator